MGGSIGTLRWLIICPPGSSQNAHSQNRPFRASLQNANKVREQLCFAHERAFPSSHRFDKFSCAGDESETVVFLRQLFRDLHHVAAHDNRQLLMRALLVDVELDICEIDYV